MNDWRQLIDAEGVWCQVLRPPSDRPARPALFLDRDGVMVVEVEYLSRPEDARLEKGAARLIRDCNRLEIPVAVVTNQAGIGYGYYGWEDFAAVQARIIADLATEGAFVDAVFACPHHAKGKPPFDHPDHPARKPNPGMLLRAKEMLSLDMRRSWIVGDRASDIEAGKRAGIRGGLHVSTGHGARPGEREACLALAAKDFVSLSADSIEGARDLLDQILP